MIYTVTFNPAVDYIVRTKALTAGAVNRSESEEIYFGGKGINVSLVLSELGVKSKALGFVAGFTGEAIEKGITEKGIDADFVHLMMSKSEDKESDAFLATDSIGSEKLVSGEYNTNVFNFADTAIRKILADIQIEEQNHAEMLYKYKTVNGMA